MSEKYKRVVRYEVCSIKEIVFTGKQHIKWNEVEEYLKRFVGLSFTVEEYKDVLHINSLFANVYAES